MQKPTASRQVLEAVIESGYGRIRVEYFASDAEYESWLRFHRQAYVARLSVVEPAGVSRGPVSREAALAAARRQSRLHPQASVKIEGVGR